MVRALFDRFAPALTPRRRVNALTRAVRTRSSAFDPLQSADRPGDAFEAAWRSGIKRRIVFALCAVALWATGVEARLMYLQVVSHGEYVDLANRQQNRVVKPVGIRGDIVDRNGEILAYSVPSSVIVAAPSSIKPAEVAGTVASLCEAFRDCTPEERVELGKRLSSGSDFAYVRRAMHVTAEQAERVKDLKLPGIELMSESRRAYPKLELASHLIGFVGVENEGLGGVEHAFDEDIRGREGLVYTLVDGRRRGMDVRVEREAAPGATVELTIDQYVQNIAERELRAGVEAHHADGGAAVVMNPATGEILAMASYPDFDPNDLRGATDAVKRNRAIQSVYEPGSTFKIVTASAALQEGVFSMSDTVDCAPGTFYVGKREIKDAEGHNYGVLPFEDVIVKSSNVGATKIGLKVGAERFSRYVQRFGFGQALLRDLSGESKGIVPTLKQMSDSALASMSMGYQVSVTPLQMATAVSVVANGGTLYEPHLVRATERDGVRSETAPKALRPDAINAETAATVTSIMEEVVHRGTGTKAQITGYQVAGKTGTAYKAIPGGYSKTDYNASFVGFVPSRQPALTIVVVVDTPRGGSYFGGDVAAPIFKRIAEASLQYLGVPRTLNPAPSIVIGGDARAQIVPTRVLHTAPVAAGPLVMPDITGLGLRDAMRLVEAAGLDVRISGSGVVSSQSPAAGSPIQSGDRTTIQLSRQPSPASTSGT